MRVPYPRAMDYGPLKGAKETAALDGIITFTYQFEKGGFRRWMRRAGSRNFRAVRVHGRVAGGCVLYDMGLWLGGRVVPSLGVAGVGVAHEHRAQGAGSDLMRGVVLEAARRGVALSSLYPATQPVYRRAGYERAGHWLRYNVPCASIDAREREPAVREGRPSDRRTLVRLYEEMARGTAGLVARNDHLWNRLVAPSHGPARPYILHEGKEAVGYVVILPKKISGIGQELHLVDCAFTRPEAGRRILSFIASQRSFVETVTWNGGPQDALAALLREQRVKVETYMHWMVRIADLPRAVAARGYAAGVAAEVEIEVEDSLVKRNSGRWVLRVAKGRGRAVRGGAGTVRCGVNALASIYTGYAAPREVRSWAPLDGPDDALAALATIFAGPAPWNREMY